MWNVIRSYSKLVPVALLITLACWAIDSGAIQIQHADTLQLGSKPTGDFASSWDSYIYVGLPYCHYNYGGSDPLYTGGATSRSIFRFDATGVIPDYAVITSAFLDLTKTGTSAGMDSIVVSHIVQAVSIGTGVGGAGDTTDVTWCAFAAVADSDSTWNSPGADAQSGVPLDQTAVGGVLDIGRTYASYVVDGDSLVWVIDVTALFRETWEGTVPNNGWLVREIKNGTVTLESNEESTVTKRPRLRVYWTDPRGAQSMGGGRHGLSP